MQSPGSNTRRAPARRSATLALAGLVAVVCTVFGPAGTSWALATAVPTILPASLSTTGTGVLSAAVAEAGGSAVTITSAGGTAVSSTAAAGGAAAIAGPVLVAAGGLTIGWKIGSWVAGKVYAPDEDVAATAGPPVGTGTHPVGTRASGPTPAGRAWFAEVFQDVPDAAGKCRVNPGFTGDGTPRCFYVRMQGGNRIGSEDLIFELARPDGSAVLRTFFPEGGTIAFYRWADMMRDYPGTIVKASVLVRPATTSPYYSARGTEVAAWDLVAQPEPHPLRRLVSTSTCKATAGGALSVVSEQSATYRETDPTMPPMTVPPCPAGSQRTIWEVTSVPVTAGQVGPKTLQRVTFPTAEQLPDYAQCVGANVCTVTYEPPAPSSTPGGAQEPARCTWGPYAMPLSDCASPDGTPAGTPAPTTTPMPGGSASPDGGACYPRGWAAFNPVEWVLKPLGCAFIPEPGYVDAELVQLRDAWSTSPPGAYIGAGLGVLGTVQSALGSAPGGSGCAGPAVSIPPPIDLVDWHPISVCPFPAVAAAARVFISGVLLFATGGGCLWVVAAALGVQLPRLGRPETAG